MKIENLVEKESVLENDYLIVEGSDGTKKAKRKAVVDSSWKLIGTATGTTNSPETGDGHSVDISDYLDKAKEFLIAVKYAYNAARTNMVTATIVLPNVVEAIKGSHPLGYYYNSNTFASLSANVSSYNLVYCPASWYNVKDSGTDITDENVTIYVYYR